MKLDPELNLFEHFSLPDFANVAGLREWEQQLPRPAVEADDVLISEQTMAVSSPSASIKLRIYQPKGVKSAPALLYFHGGSFVMGNLETDHGFCCQYAQDAGVAVVAVDYRLAPEHRFPTGVEDCYAALLWLADKAPVLAIDAKRLAVAGSSAGGTLAAAVAIMARDRGGPKLSLQMLIYPALDDHMITPSINAAGPQYGVTREVIGHMWRHYLGDTGRSHSPYAAPAHISDCSNLAPVYMEVGALDPLRDEVIDYARRLLQAHIATELHVLAGAPHAFDIAASATVTVQAMTMRATALKKALC